MRPSSDRNLLFGVLALQMDFISRDALVEAMNTWVLDKDQPLGQILRAQGALGESEFTLLEALVTKHLERHGNDAHKSLAALSSLGSARHALQKIADADLHATLAHVGTDVSPAVSYGVPAAPRFRILRAHARGGLGEVFVARDEELGREVALKEIQSHHAHDQGSRNRFVLEAEVTGGLEHPGIVPVYGLGHYGDGRPYYAMRFIKGDSLKEAIKHYHDTDSGHRELELRKLLRRFYDVCNALSYAHSRGVLHRDLKPGNIMLGKYGETLVVDWGLAKTTGKVDGATSSPAEAALQPASASGSAPTVMGRTMGTPAFMPPEQAAGRWDLLGPASDVYSLGATLYTVLTGQPPFNGDDVLAQVQRGDFPKPCQLKPDVPRALEAVCLKAMALQPQDRYASTAALGQDIERYLDDQPVSAWREPLSVRLRRKARQHRVLLTAVILALLLGTPISTYFAIDASQQAIIATANEKNALDAAAEEQKANALAQERLRQVEKVNDIIVSIFRNLDPRQAEKDIPLGVQVGEGLHRASTELEKIEGADPLTVSRLQDELGLTQATLGHFNRAVTLFQKALSVRETKLGPDHADTLSTRNNLAQAFYMAGSTDQALRLHEKNLMLREAKLGSDHADTLGSRNNLALALRAAGKKLEALRLHQENLKLYESKLGSDHPATLTSRNNVAAGLAAAGKNSEALRLYQENLMRSEAMHGFDHIDTLSSRDRVAIALRVAGKTAEALRLHQENLRLYESKLGLAHPDTLSSRNGLAVTLRVAGKTAESLQLHQVNLKLREAHLGADHPDTLASRNNLAVAFGAAGKMAEALSMHAENLKFRETKLGPDHPDTVNSRGQVAYLYLQLNQPADAEPLFLRVVTAQRALQSPKLAVTLTLVAKCQVQLKKYEQAELYLRESLPLFEATGPKAAFFDTQSWLGASLTGQKKYAVAEPLVLAGYNGLKKTGTSRALMLAALERVVALYEAWERPDDAARWRKELDGLRAKTSK